MRLNVCVRKLYDEAPCPDLSDLGGWSGACGRRQARGNRPAWTGGRSSSRTAIWRGYPRGWRTKLAGGWIHSHWSLLVGDRIAGHTKVEKFADKKLYISCDSTAWASNLRTMQRNILSTIEEKVGPDIVTELRISGPKPPSWRYGPLHVKGRGPRDTYG